MHWWTLVDECIENNAFPNHFLQLATIKDDNSPAVRTLVYRGRNEEQHILMISDTRSEKYAQLMSNPKAEISWYFYDTREQFRISGETLCVTPKDQDFDVSRLWQDLSPAAKQQYFWPKPGVPITDKTSTYITGKNDTRGKQEKLHQDELDLTDPPSHFCVIKLIPVKVDYLQLSQPKHERQIFEYDIVSSQWHSIALTP
ncbi:hypothetical protein HF888_00960 [Bermanella marisrubri]|uniref:Pyridoxamine 5'-phosphate oxidase Alr4036 family FMN-binding domain-containing protein n=1 Tax=Bermanella marisrubri TaxID=207949 RepID=Q1N479_9GAMM|nr:pyridoxamine 5'-phosphate oxidase family protein [Bermanella marisrubri]EAT12986.1 hypothetical protein RED65_14857 [Oceanobacter sp. RED65] [Bermanella marisrubri]QIZ82887.1 hypothetical protein HF888_00960 [Bermanella marisrubri]